MDVLSAPTRYADALVFAAEVTEAATRTLGGARYEEELKAPFFDALSRQQSDWEWCDNREDVDLVAGQAMAATVDFLARRHALAVPCSLGEAPARLWPDSPRRIDALREALEFAASVAEYAWPHELDGPLARWIRERLTGLLAPTADDEPLACLESRVRLAVVICHRYRCCRYQLFGDRHWTGGPPAPWWCPDRDLAARSPFDGYATGEVPAYLLRLDRGSPRDSRGTLSVATTPAAAVREYPVQVRAGVAVVPPDAGSAAREAAQDAVTALGRV